MGRKELQDACVLGECACSGQAKAKAARERYDALTAFLKQPHLVLACTDEGPGAPALILNQISGQVHFDEDANRASVSVTYGQRIAPPATRPDGGGQITMNVEGDGKNPRSSGEDAMMEDTGRNQDPAEEAVVEDILREYRALRETLRSLAELAGKQRRAAAGEARTEGLDEALKTLRRQMERLFEYEEKGGLFDDLLALFPAEALRIEALQEEHPALLQRIDELIAKVGKPELSELKVLRKELRSFVRALESHEERESGWVQRPGSDEGTID